VEQCNRPFSGRVGFVLKTLVFATLLNYAPTREQSPLHRLSNELGPISAPSSTVREESFSSGIEKGRRINQARWTWS
jgi:hypothetical protein